MKIAVAKETRKAERRVSVVPETGRQLTELGAKVMVETGAGREAGFEDDDYRACGSTIVEDRAQLYRAADIVTWVKRPREDLERSLQIMAGTMIAGFLDASAYGEHLQYYAGKGLTTFSWDLLPNNELTQHMHASALMSSYAGRIAFLNALKTVSQTRSHDDSVVVLVLGSGNAGMAAAETARQMGSSVIVASTRSDSRDYVKNTLSGVFVSLGSEPVRSLASSERQQQMRLIELIAVNQPDAIICAARRFGHKPPKLITGETIDVMKPGTVIEDVVATRGGNTVFSERDKEVIVKNSILIRNKSNYPSQEAEGASTGYSRCMGHLLERIIARSRSQPGYEPTEDPLLQTAFATHRGHISSLHTVATSDCHSMPPGRWIDRE